jgi:8-oxo-dGTP diphosphatase
MKPAFVSRDPREYGIFAGWGETSHGYRFVGALRYILEVNRKSGNNQGREMARALVLAAGGIVLRHEKHPLIAVVRLRKRNEWVLPKGKLDDGETPRAAAEREVWEETGHTVSVHEFLGTLVYESGGRSKVVHYWRMEARGGPSRELMHDVTAVDWLPLEDAVGRLSRSYEQAFLANVGPLALEASRRPKAKPAMPRKRRGRRLVAADPAHAEPVAASPPPELVAASVLRDERLAYENPREREVVTLEAAMAPAAFEGEAGIEDDLSAAPALDAPSLDDAARTADPPRINLVQKVRDWLRRAA